MVTRENIRSDNPYTMFFTIYITISRKNSYHSYLGPKNVTTFLKTAVHLVNVFFVDQKYPRLGKMDYLKF